MTYNNFTEKLKFSNAVNNNKNKKNLICCHANPFVRRAKYLFAFLIFESMTSL